MADQQATQTTLIFRISRASYDMSRGVVYVNGFCLSSAPDVALHLLIDGKRVKGARVETGFDRADVHAEYPEFDQPKSGWRVRVRADLPDHVGEISVLAIAGDTRERAIRALETFQSDPFVPEVSQHAPLAQGALGFAEIRGIHPLQRYVHRFGNNIVNCFDIDAWASATVLHSLSVRVVVRAGAVKVALRHIQRGDSAVTELARLDQDGPGTQVSAPIKLSDYSGAFVPVVLAESAGANYDIVFVTDDRPAMPHARINYVFCTFKRADYVQRNAEVFRTYLRRFKAEHRAHLTIVDNGSQTDAPCGVRSGTHITVMDNENTGGAGGFGRGIYESCYGALASQNFTHVCLLDDDIYLDMEMFARNDAFVRFLKPGHHLGAPMYGTSDPAHAPHQPNCFGHRFRGSTHPSDKAIGNKLVAGDPHGFIRMDRTPDSTGWWWDCIAVEDIHRIGLPYPFFIKMDDMEYSLRLRDAGVRLVIPFSFWVLHDDFDEKYSAAMQYFRFRNRWVLLAQRDLIDDPTAFTRAYCRMVHDFVAERKYEHAQLLLDAMDHFLKGPEHLVSFEKPILKGIFATVKKEKNAPMPVPPDHAPVMNELAPPASARTAWLNRVTVNNHFLPLREKVAIDLNRPHQVTDCRRGATVSYWNPAKAVGFTVERNSMRAMRQISRLRAMRRRMRALPDVLAAYRSAFAHFTSQAFWATYGHVGAAPRIRPDTGETAAIANLRNEVSRLHIALQQRGALDDHETREVTAQDEAFFNALRNRYLGQRCFILGNGPSLTVEDIELVRNDVTFAANKIYLAFKETSWRPTFYSVEDLLVARNNTAEIMAVEGTTKIFPHHMLPILPRQANHHYARWLPPADNRSPYREFSTDLTKGICWGSTITYSMLQMAVHMGFRDIYLLGLDHSYVEPKTRVDGALVSEGEQNHFHPDYRKKGEVWHYPVLDRLERSYSFAREYCDSIGVSIYNASRRTELDAFPRVDLDRVTARPARIVKDWAPQQDAG